MKRVLVTIVVFMVSFSGFSQKKKELINEVAQLKLQLSEVKAEVNDLKKAEAINLEDELQKFCYSFGISIGENLKSVGFDSLAYRAFALGLEDVIKGTEKLPVHEAESMIRSTIQKRQEEKAKEKRAEGEHFLAENGKKPEVVTTASGLQYEILKKGVGAIPVSTDKVSVHYSGMLINGEVFDSSIERNEPATFGVTGVIKGWQEVLQLMPQGSKWKVFIPENLGYGERGAGGGDIPPYSVLIFEMELLEIK